MRLGERCASRAACQSCAQLTWLSRYASTTSRPLCTSGLERCAVEPVPAAHRSSPEVHSGRLHVLRAAQCDFAGHGPCSPFLCGIDSLWLWWAITRLGPSWPR